MTHAMKVFVLAPHPPVARRPREPAGGSDWMPISGITMYDEWEEHWTWYGNMMHPSDHEYRVRAVDNGAYSDWVYLSVDGAPSYDLPGRPGRVRITGRCRCRVVPGPPIGRPGCAGLAGDPRRRSRSQPARRGWG